MNTVKTIKEKFDSVRENACTDEEINAISEVLSTSKDINEDLLFILDNYDIANDDKIRVELLKYKETLMALRIENSSESND